jgi:beta-glucosidase
VETKYNPKEKKTVLGALRHVFGHENVQFVDVSTEGASTDTALLMKEARRADVVVVTLAEKPSTEIPGDIHFLSFPKPELDLVRSLKDAGKPMVAVLMTARPRLMGDVAGQLDAILMTYRLGSEGGRAVAATLIGENNPSGKLPFTYPRFPGTIIPYDHKTADERDTRFEPKAFNPLFEFGHGLSYTSFVYSNLKVTPKTPSPGETIAVTVDVTNTGERPGKAVVELYTRDHFASLTPRVKKLRRFEKIALYPGEKKTVSFSLTDRDLAFVNQRREWVAEPGKFDVIVGTLTETFELAQ